MDTREFQLMWRQLKQHSSIPNSPDIKEAEKLLNDFRRDTSIIVERATQQMLAIEREYAEKTRRRRAKQAKH